MKRSSLIPAIALVMFAALPAAAQTATVTLKVTDVKEGVGSVMASLCGDPDGQFPGACLTYSATSIAMAGDTIVSFEGVAPGRYAVQAFHDENGDMMLNIPDEGYAFGNDAPWPPTFEAASIVVSGDTDATVRLMHIPVARVPSNDAAPRE